MQLGQVLWKEGKDTPDPGVGPPHSCRSDPDRPTRTPSGGPLTEAGVQRCQRRLVQGGTQRALPHPGTLNPSTSCFVEHGHRLAAPDKTGDESQPEILSRSRDTLTVTNLDAVITLMSNTSPPR